MGYRHAERTYVLFLTPLPSAASPSDLCSTNPDEVESDICFHMFVQVERHNPRDLQGWKMLEDIVVTHH